MKKAFCTILLLAMTVTARAILIPDWTGTYSEQYADAITPEPILIDRIVLERIVYGRIGIDRIGIDALSIFTFREIRDMATILNDAVASVKAEHEITTAKQTRDWTKVLARFGADIGGKIQFLAEGGQFPKVSNSFFIGLGEVTSVKEAELALSIRGLDSFLVPVYEPSGSNYNDIIKAVRKSNKKILPAFDYEYGEVETMKFVQKYGDDMSAMILLWGQQNAIDVNPTQYADMLHNAEMIYYFSKSIRPDLPVYLQVAYDPAVYDGLPKHEWWLSYLTFKPDGLVWWGCYELDAYIHGDCPDRFIAMTPEGMDVIVAGLFGFTPGSTWDKEAKEAAHMWWKQVKPMLRQKTNGVILIGVQNWAQKPGGL